VLVIPAIDLLGGCAVRLTQGRREDATVYDRAPWEVAARFAAQGATRLHVVDLDGAFAGRPENTAAVARILAAAPGLAVQVGGGVRDRATIDRLLGEGARFVVLGTAAVRDAALLGAACAAHPGRIIVALDARDGKVALAGWTEGTALAAAAVGRAARAAGAAAVLCTDIARDGMRTGPNVAATAALAAALAPLPVIASGGVGALADLVALRDAGVEAAIVGRALYEGAFTVAEAIAAAR
jgi:phosphoribosylformimino-5-aminoimidazole carboxamide ribotide isomerase